MNPKFASIRQFERIYLPHRILNRLEEDLCSLLGITESTSHLLHKEKDCQKRGLIELHPVSPYSLSDLMGRIKEFYAEEGYKVNGECETGAELTRKEEKHDLLVYQHGNNYFVWISKPILGVEMQVLTL